MKTLEIAVAQDIPVPAGRKGKQPFFNELYTMKVGASFAVPLEYGMKLRRAAAWATRTTRRKFTCQRDEEHRDQQRVWRIE